MTDTHTPPIPAEATPTEAQATETPGQQPEPEGSPMRHAPLDVAVGSSASGLQSAYLGHRGERAQSQARGRLAILRRSAGATPERHPLTLQDVLDSLSPALDPQLLGRGDAASPSERAAYHAMTLFALHMQSATVPAHVTGRSFGQAVGILRARSGSGSLKPRFDAMLAARDERSRLQHARTLITLLRGESIGLDYGRFARDLRTLSGSRRSGVLLRWSRDVATASYPEPAAAAAPDSTARPPRAAVAVPPQ
ncbi:type I-E CRISPR-associated protein Cse2/CasB [Brachybacterium squillarum]|uniref:type I-E CRISPR-associated protein Cse2/CasB n=1 Tax=Brachybacterium squillarum TaxID=661979 RepID=UPI0002629ADD|nr:type I-E CRISPR-associated protein Cse2/CasB [Brachybacterium squillarum]